MAEQGWYTDPHNAEQLRYWDGSRWLDYTRERPVASAPAAAVSAQPQLSTSRVAAPGAGMLSVDDDQLPAGGGDETSHPGSHQRQSATIGSAAAAARSQTVTNPANGKLVSVVAAGAVVAALFSFGVSALSAAAPADTCHTLTDSALRCAVRPTSDTEPDTSLPGDDSAEHLTETTSSGQGDSTASSVSSNGSNSGTAGSAQTTTTAAPAGSPQVTSAPLDGTGGALAAACKNVEHDLRAALDVLAAARPDALSGDTDAAGRYLAATETFDLVLYDLMTDISEDGMTMFERAEAKQTNASILRRQNVRDTGIDAAFTVQQLELTPITSLGIIAAHMSSLDQCTIVAAELDRYEQLLTS